MRVLTNPRAKAINKQESMGEPQFAAKLTKTLVFRDPLLIPLPSMKLTAKPVMVGK